MAAETSNSNGKAAAPAWRVERVFLGSRTAEEVVAALIRAHTA